MAEDFGFLSTNKKTNFINQFIEKNNHSLLVVFSRKYSFIETIFHKSITDKLTCRSKLPIFVIKEK